VCHVIQLREFLTTERMLGMNAIMNRGSLVCVCVCVCVCVSYYTAPPLVDYTLHRHGTIFVICGVWHVWRMWHTWCVG
jgi:hypothetical protein